MGSQGGPREALAPCVLRAQIMVATIIVSIVMLSVTIIMTRFIVMITICEFC